mmetsp:Transcript_35425/g.109266  ORF Transcript_35425/g.109266 Transcript_35425/m.109266 type:complete len:202 (-) Transcript_35425:367-972(-)
MYASVRECLRCRSHPGDYDAAASDATTSDPCFTSPGANSSFTAAASKPSSCDSLRARRLAMSRKERERLVSKAVRSWYLLPCLRTTSADAMRRYWKHRGSGTMTSTILLFTTRCSKWERTTYASVSSFTVCTVFALLPRFCWRRALSPFVFLFLADSLRCASVAWSPPASSSSSPSSSSSEADAILPSPPSASAAAAAVRW